MADIKDIINGISQEQVKTHIRNLEGIRHPKVAPDALEKAADYIWAQLSSWGYQMSVHHFSEDDCQYRNIIGTLVGTQQPQKRIIVMAHYDTVPTSPGANDNASGVAVMLELARVLRNSRLARTVQFTAVNLEERKDDTDKNSTFLRGSRALAAHAHQEGWEIEGVVNFEEVAYAGEAVVQSMPENFPLPLPEIGDFIGIIGNENSADMVRGYIQAIQEYEIPLPFVPMIVPGDGSMFPDVRRSDHAAFWDLGYRAIMLTDTANFRTPHYHMPSDVLDTLNLSFATQVCRAAGGLVIRMADHES